MDRINSYKYLKTSNGENIIKIAMKLSAYMEGKKYQQKFCGSIFAEVRDPL